MTGIDKFCGMLLGQAAGDALGAPLDALSVATMKRQFGPFGLRTPVRSPKTSFLALLSPNTQMMLATADGLLWASAKKIDRTEGLYRGYMRWYYGQTGEEARRGQRTWVRRQPHEREFCLAREKFMRAKRGMGSTLVALASETPGSLKNKINEANDSEALVRSGPIGLIYAGNVRDAFYEAVRAAVLTHTNPLAYQAAAAFAGIIAGLSGKRTTLPKVLDEVMALLNKSEHTEALTALLSAAITQANDHPAGKGTPFDHVDSLHSLGTGKKAEEALAMGVYCALANDDPFEAVLAAAHHDGKSSVTASIVGAIEGARLGRAFLPDYWMAHLEGADIIEAVAKQLYKTWEDETASQKSVKKEETQEIKPEEKKAEKTSDAKPVKKAETKSAKKIEKTEEKSETKSSKKPAKKAEKATEKAAPKKPAKKEETKSAPKSETKTVKAPSKESETKSVKKTEAKPESKTEKKAVKEPVKKNETKSEAKPVKKTVKKPETKPVQKAETKSAQKAEAKPEKKAEKQAEKKTEKKSTKKAETKPAKKTEVKATKKSSTKKS